MMSTADPESELVEACAFALENNLGLKRQERVLIVTDKQKKNIGEAFERAALVQTSHVRLIEIPVLEFPGQEPSGQAAAAMLRSDVVLMPLTRSLSWTEARMKATEKGARIASMPGISKETVLRTFFQDYQIIRRRVNCLCDLLDQAGSIRLTADSGTEITFGIKGRKGRGRRGGIYTERGAWGNLPCGEAFIAPVEGSAEGVYIVDLSHTGVGRVIDPIRLRVRKGRVCRITGGPQSNRLDSVLRRFNHPDAFNIAEFGIGCNEKAAACGITLEAEKSLGTVHIALGGNFFFGGTTQIGIHLDGVVNKPTVEFDEKMVMHRGELKVA